jgi:hypothetical protein
MRCADVVRAEKDLDVLVDRERVYHRHGTIEQPHHTGIFGLSLTLLCSANLSEFLYTDRRPLPTLIFTFSKSLDRLVKK